MSFEMSRQQAAIIQKTIGRELRYLGKLQRRMELCGVSPTDDNYRVTREAYNAVPSIGFSGFQSNSTSFQMSRW